MKAVASLVLLLVAGTSVLGENPRKPTAYGELYNLWKADVEELKDASPTLTVQERRKKTQEINETYTPRFLKLAQEHQQDGLWVQCLIWTTVNGVPGKEYDAMFDLMRDNAAALDSGDWLQLRLLMSEFIPLDSERINPALLHISKTHSSKGVRGTALYALAARTKRQAERDGDPKGCQRAEQLLETVVSEYPTGTTYRGSNLENANALLEELRSPIAIAQPAPATTGQTIDGEDFSLSDSRGRVTVLAFSGHWCGPCVAMHPTLKKLLDKYDRDRLAVIEINSDQKQHLEKVRRKIEEDSLDWIVVPEGRKGPLAKNWHVTDSPTYYVLDPQHQIRRRATGNVGSDLIEWVDELIREAE